MLECVFVLTVALFPISTQLESWVTHTTEGSRHVNTAVSTFSLTRHTFIYVWEEMFG